MHIIKEITTGYGFPASIWDINTVTIKRQGATYRVSGNISLYFSDIQRLAGGSVLDNCIFEFTDITQADIDGDLLSVLYTKVITTRPVSDGGTEGGTIEGNYFQTSLSGQVCFVGCQIETN